MNSCVDYCLKSWGIERAFPCKTVTTSTWLPQTINPHWWKTKSHSLCPPKPKLYGSETWSNRLIRKNRPMHEERAINQHVLGCQSFKRGPNKIISIPFRAGLAPSKKRLTMVCMMNSPSMSTGIRSQGQIQRKAQVRSCQKQEITRYISILHIYLKSHETGRRRPVCEVRAEERHGKKNHSESCAICLCFVKFSSAVKFVERIIQPMVNRIGFQATSRQTTNWSLAKVEQLLVRASRYLSNAWCRWMKSWACNTKPNKPYINDGVFYQPQLPSISFKFWTHWLQKLNNCSQILVAKLLRQRPEDLIVCLREKSVRNA